MAGDPTEKPTFPKSKKITAGEISKNMQRVFLLAAGGATYYFVTKSSDTDTKNDQTTSSQTDSNSAETEELDDDEDYTRVVINPVDNITANQEAQEVSTAEELV